MSAWTNGTYTVKGIALLSKLTQGSSLKITRAVTGTGYVTPTILAQQTAVTGIKQTLTFRPATYPEAGKCKLPMYLTNDEVTTKYTAKQIGLYATDPDEGEILYFIMQSSDGTLVPSAAEMSGYNAEWTVYFQYGQADEVSVTVDPSNMASLDDLAQVQAIAEEGASDTAAGEVVVFDDAAELPFTGLTIYGKSTQDGTPTPDAPVEIESVGDSGDIEVAVCGKNLANHESEYTATFYGITIAIAAGSAEAVLNGTATKLCSNKIMRSHILPAGTYTISVSGINVHDTAVDRLLVRNESSDAVVVNYIQDGRPKKFTLSELSSICVDMVFNEGSTYANKTIKIQIECGDTATDYEPHTVQRATLETPNGLPGIPVSSGGNYTDTEGQMWVCDEIDLARGVYVKRVYTETRAFNYDATNSRYSTLLSYEANANCGTQNGIPVLCDILPFNANAAYGSNGIRAATTSPKYAVAYYNGQEITTATVSYPLAEPIETALTDAEIAAYKALHSNMPVTTVLNDAGAEMVVGCVKRVYHDSLRMVLDQAGQNGGICVIPVLAEDPSSPVTGQAWIIEQ